MLTNYVFLSFCLKLVNSGNILCVFVIPSFSHQIVYRQIYRELSLRHLVTVVTPNPLNDPFLTNLTEINVNFTYSFLDDSKIQKLFSKDANIFQNLDKIYRLVDDIVEADLKFIEKLIIKNRSHFDLIIVECYHPALYALGFQFKAPVIGVSSLGVPNTIYNVIGNPTHPYLYPDHLLSFHYLELTLWQKIQSVAFDIYLQYYYFYVSTPRAQILAEKIFGNIPYVGDLEKNLSLLFLNVNSVLNPIRPNVPVVIEMGFMHIEKIRPLPEDLKIILDKSTQGVVYFSLGTNVKSITLSKKLQNILIETFADLPFTILWKYESDYLENKPKNVIVRKWWPQQDILAHHNVKLFISQGGLQSIEEAISRGVPLLCLPFMGDQPMNARRVTNLQIGLDLNPETLTKHELKRNILKIVENIKFKENIEEIRNAASDRQMTGLEKAVWWSEYLIRHKGVKHLKSPSANISLFEYLFLDVILSIIFIILFLYKMVMFLKK